MRLPMINTRHLIPSINTPSYTPSFVLSILPSIRSLMLLPMINTRRPSLPVPLPAPVLVANGPTIRITLLSSTLCKRWPTYYFDLYYYFNPAYQFALSTHPVNTPAHSLSPTFRYVHCCVFPRWPTTSTFVAPFAPKTSPTPVARPPATTERDAKRTRWRTNTRYCPKHCMMMIIDM